MRESDGRLRRGGAADGSWITKDVMLVYGLEGDGLAQIAEALDTGLCPAAAVEKAIERLRFLERGCDDLAALLAGR